MKRPILKLFDLLILCLCGISIRVCDQALLYTLDSLVGQPLPRITYLFARTSPWHCLTLLPWVIVLVWLSIRKPDDTELYPTVMRGAVAFSMALSLGILAGALIAGIPIHTGLIQK